MKSPKKFFMNSEYLNSKPIKKDFKFAKLRSVLFESDSEKFMKIRNSKLKVSRTLKFSSGSSLSRYIIILWYSSRISIRILVEKAANFCEYFSFLGRILVEKVANFCVYFLFSGTHSPRIQNSQIFFWMISFEMPFMNAKQPGELLLLNLSK